MPVPTPYIQEQRRKVRSARTRAFYASLSWRHQPLPPVSSREKSLPPPSEISHELRELIEAEKKLHKPKTSRPNGRNITPMVSWLNEIGYDVPDMLEWRWLGGVVGEIHGIPNSRGLAMMTNGVLVLIDQGSAMPPFKGHIKFFVPDEEAVDDALPPKSPKKKVNKQVMDNAMLMFERLKAIG